MKQIGVPPGALSHKDKMYILKASSRISNSEIKWCKVPAIREPNNTLHQDDIIANLSVFRSILGKDEQFCPVYSLPVFIVHNTRVHPAWLPFMEVWHPGPCVPLGTLCIHFAVIAAEVVKALASARLNIRTIPNYTLMVAVAGERAEVVKTLLSAGINIKSVPNRTLMAAIHGEHAEVVKTLISAGVDIKYLLPKQMIATEDLLENDKRHLEAR